MLTSGNLEKERINYLIPTCALISVYFIFAAFEFSPWNPYVNALTKGCQSTDVMQLVLGGVTSDSRGPELLRLKSTDSSAVGSAPPGSPLSQPESTEPHTSHFLSCSLLLDCVNCCRPARWVGQQVKYKRYAPSQQARVISARVI